MFNPNEHMMNLKGKDYLQVAWRLVWFREEHPDWSIDANALEMDENHAIFKAVICDENGQQKSVGHGSESKKDFGDFLEKAETKAVGRALAMLGYGTQFAPDLDEGERIVDSPINREKNEENIVIPQKGDWNYHDALSLAAKDLGITQAQLDSFRRTLIKAEKLPYITNTNLTPLDVENMVKAIRENLEELKKAL